MHDRAGTIAEPEKFAGELLKVLAQILRSTLTLSYPTPT